MNPNFRAEILAMPTAELAERNGAGLLAAQLQSTARDDIEIEDRHAAEVAAYDPTRLRAELIQVAAVCVQWIEAIDGRTA